MDLTRVFRLLGNPARLEILKILLKGARCVGKIVEEMKISQPAVTQHLKVLETLGLAKGDRKGARVHYSIQTEGIQTLKEELSKFLALLEIIEEKCEDLEKCKKV